MERRGFLGGLTAACFGALLEFFRQTGTTELK